ncbi:MAG: hypothetical protein ACREGB_01960, partial [Candidatus Saccharimonadales bacterium]
INGGCSTLNTPRYCSATITGLNVTANTPVAFNLRSLYSKTNVDIEAFNSGSPNTPLPLSGAQTLIDSTGRSQNILKRIQVRVSNNGHYDIPGFDVESGGSICKQYTVYPGYAAGCEL